MTCFHPLYAYPARPAGPQLDEHNREVPVARPAWLDAELGTAKRSRSLVFSAKDSYAGARAIKIPCGQCIGCRLAKSQDWATRIMHEAQLFEDNCFITPTFSDQHLPDDYSVSVRTHQLFIKRFRQLWGGPMRYFGCGEYGGLRQRPHYHDIFFGVHFEDRYPWMRSPAGELLYRSPLLERAWPFGHVLIGSVTRQSAAYVARYVIKKITGEPAAEHYTRCHPVTGEVCKVRPEFIVMSRRPGIGAGWYERFASDAFPSDFVVMDGRRVPVPAFYKRRLDAEDERTALRILAKRKAAGRLHADNNTDDRLQVREEVQRLRMERLHRALEAVS